jgi:hypothetical protein
MMEKIQENNNKNIEKNFNETPKFNCTGCGQKEAQSWKEVLENEFELTLYKVCYFMYINVPST